MSSDETTTKSNDQTSTKPNDETVLGNTNEEATSQKSSSSVTFSAGNKDKKKKEKKSPKDRESASVSDTLSFVYRCGLGTQLLFILGTISGIAHGLAWPALAYFLSQSYQTMSGASALAPEDDPMGQIRSISYTFMALGAYSFVTAFFQTFSLELVSARASRLLQMDWFRALLRQDAAFFDVTDVSGMVALVNPAAIAYSKGIGRKLGELIQNLATGIGGIIFALYSSWKVALLVFGILPFLAGSSYAAIQMNQSKTARSSMHYQEAGSVAYTTMSSIRTVLSLNAVEEMIRQYQVATQHAFESATAVLLKLGFWNGMITASFSSLFAVVVLFGSFVMYREVEDVGCSPGGGDNSCPITGADVFGAMLGLLFAGQSSSQVGNCSDSFQEARVAAYEALQVINRMPGKTPAKTIYKKNQDGEDMEQEQGDASSKLEEGQSPSANVKAILPAFEIDPFAKDGLKPEDIKGTLELKNVSFSYPTRPSELILDGIDIEIPAGKTAALVGPSGGGKSTVTKLFTRSYDPTGGNVSLDGNDIRSLNLSHYRHMLGYVGQEPVLFSTTIADNIAYGVDGKVTREQIEAAAKMANAHDFIMSFPQGYDTEVGDKGSQLSGGQKQRIAIARALIKEPKLLILDEATSALDYESELVVQDALDHILEQRSITTIIIAHRLSTIRSADIIYVISGGKAVERGTHEELMASGKGYYRQLVEKQERPTQRQMSSRDSFQSTGTASSDDLGSEKFMTDDGAPADMKQTPQIEFKDVSFAYPARPRKKIFNDFNLAVMPGETVALVGPSGQGKSTSISLLLRFYDPSEGTVNFSGHDIRSLNVHWYRDQIGYVGQEPTLFNTTIAKNIAYGCPTASQSDIEYAAKQANAHDFIMKFPEGYNTSVGENAAQLSGGQKQRIAIARALIKKPKLMIFDEATSALDSQSEAIVHEALSKLMASRQHTSLVIAHKLSTVMDADRIAFVAHGRVVEFGSHDELLSKPHGHYKRLVEAQKRDSTLGAIGSIPSIEESLKRPKSNNVDHDEADSDDEEEDKAPEDDYKNKDRQSLVKRIKQMASPDTGYILAGSIGAVMAGASYPLMGILFALSIDLYYYRLEDDCDPNSINSTLPPGFQSCNEYWSEAAEDMQQQSFNVALYYCILIADSLIGGALIVWGFGQASERLSRRFRDQTFTALVRQEVGYFDKRSIGNISSELQESCARLHAFSGAPVRQFLEAMTSLLSGVILSYIYMWPFALLCTACIPFMAVASKLRRADIVGEDEGAPGASQKMTSSGGILVETLLNMKTVSALALEEKRLEEYAAAIRESQKDVIPSSITAGVTSGIGMFIQRFQNALLYFFGGYLLINYPDQYEFQDFLIAQFAFLFSSFGLAAALQDMEDRNEVEESARRILSILDRKSAIDPLSKEGKKLD